MSRRPGGAEPIANLRELLAAGFGQPLDAPIQVTGRALTWSERRRVQRLVRRGEAAWDLPSARYAVELARATERAPSFLSPRASRIFLGVLAVGAALMAAGHWADDGLSVAAVFYTAGAAVLGVIAVRSPVWVENAPVARVANQALVDEAAPGHASEVDAPFGPPVMRRRSVRDERLGLALAIALMALLFGGGFAAADGEDVIGGLVSGLVFGVVFVPFLRHVARQSQSAGAGDGGGSGAPRPIAVETWERLPVRLRLLLRVAGALASAFLLWIMVLGSTQLSTCDTSEGGLAPTEQVGFTQAYCGTPGAGVGDAVLVYALVGGLPLFGLLIGAFGAGWRTGSARLRLLALGVALVTLPTGLTWALAGAH